MDNSPIEFVENQGQWDGSFIYKATYGNVNFYLEKNAFTYQIGAADNVEKIHDHKHGKADKAPILKYHVYKVNMLGANQQPKIVGGKEKQYYYNYYLSNDSSRWRTFIHPNLTVDYQEIYNKVDLHIASSGRNIKYDFIAKPGAEVDKIQLQFEGVDDIKIKDQNLVISTAVGEVHEMAPYAYQYLNGARVEVPCKYKLHGNVLSYHFPKGYDKSATLIIDPNIVFASFSGSSADNWGFTATYDNQGNFYAGGIVNGAGYPVTTGLLQYTGGDGADSNVSPNPQIQPFRSDMGISKFNPTGTTMLYSTYIGGSSQDQPHSMVVDNAGVLYIAGRSYSSNFPSTVNTHAGRSDIVVAKLNANGTLASSRLIGGSEDDGVNISSVYGTNHSLKHSYADDARSEILVDNAGSVYVAGCSKSANFPMINATKSSLTGGQDGVVVKLSNNLNNILWSTYVGGNDVDAAYVLAFNNTQSSVYVSGGTASNDFTGTGGLWNTYQGGSADGFIIKYQNSGTYPIQRSTLIGRAGYDQCFGIQVDANENVYVNGQTLGGGFPVTTGVYSNANSSQFLMKLDSNLNTNVYSTVYGSGNLNTTDMTPVAFLVDTCENVYISGWGGNNANNGGNVGGMPIKLTPAPTPANIVSATTADNSDFYFIVFSKNATGLLFAAYYGGANTDEHVDGGTSRFDKNGVVYQAICGGCGGLSTVPTTSGAYKTANGSANCNLLALKIAFNLGAVDAVANAQPNALVCLGDPVTLSSFGSANATSYEWDLGDGNTSTQPSPVHTYTQGGTYNVRLIVVNPDACKDRDTAFLTITVDSNSINADFTITPTDSCKPYIGTITNNSKGSGTTTYQWDFGDGKTFNGRDPGQHEYDDTGTYTVRLIVSDPNACNQADTAFRVISFNDIYVEASFDFPTLCENTEGLFNNKSSNAASFLWSFGDGNTSTDANPTHAYESSGSYTVTLRSYNPATCNQVDSLTKQVTVAESPIAQFSYSPIIPVTNDPVVFTNRSEKATAYVWDFGDGTFSELITPAPKYYKRTGTYRVCLQALNEIGCSDTICRNVDADVFPLADLPKAFSPNGDGANDILYVRGSGIESIDLKIYNRWGELIFESTDISIGWDGKYKGKEQPVEAYGYVLNVVFVDETTFYKRGNVTLLR